MCPTPFRTLSRAIAGLLIIALFASFLPGAVFTVRAAAGDITRISVSSSEAQSNSYSRDADVSADGRFVVFWSAASNLVPGDTNGWEEIFLRDLQTGDTTRVSVSSSGAQADSGSYYPAISGDGRFVSFMSDATNLVSGDTNGLSDIFLHDRQTGTTTRISVSSSGAQADGVSDSYAPMSNDGRFIVFQSDATNLVSGDTNSATDVFVYDRQTGSIERVSLDSSEVQANNGSSNPSISSDGRFVAFSSSATNLVSGDNNAQTDVFVRDRVMGLTTRVTVNSNGAEADRGGQDAAISGNGRYVTFVSLSTNLMNEEPFGYPHVFIHDRETGTTTLVSREGGWQMVGTSSAPDISADGRYIAFEFEDRGDGLAFWAIYLHDQLTGDTARVSGSGGDSEDSWFGPAISADGIFVAFSTSNDHLISNDTNGQPDVYLRELAITSPETASFPSNGTYDGWIIETGETNETGTRIDDRASTLFLGDANNDQQYRSILHFGTGALPNHAIVTRATVKIKRQGIVGTNPFTTHGRILLDIRGPYFDTSVELQPSDFQAAADGAAVSAMESVQGAVWYTAILDASAFPFINVTGPTQFRLRFELDDNDDNGQDYIKFYSGDAAADQPILTIEYYLNSSDDPSVLGIFRTSPELTSASNVDFSVAFSEPVTGVDVTDFLLTTSGGIGGASVKEISGSGDTYQVTVQTGAGNGTIRLDLIDDDSIRDESDRQLGGPQESDGDFNSGEAYTITRATFVDVPATHAFYPYVEAFYKAGITAGCSQSPRRYCPDNPVTRGEMAVFLERAMGNLSPTPSPSNMFSDVPAGNPFKPFIEQLYNDRITGGCNLSPLMYCPQSYVTRGQMAVFIERAIGNFSPTPDPTGMFTDVLPGDPFRPFIEELYNDRITGGCNLSPLMYCPQSYVTRGQMAVFIVKAFGISLLP